MFKLSIFGKKKDLNKFLALSINAKSVKCLAFYYDLSNFKIIGSGKRDIEYKDSTGITDLDSPEAIEAVSQAVEEATQDLGEDVNQVIVGINNAVSLGITTTAKSTRTPGTPIDKKESDDFYRKVLEASNMQAVNEYFQITGNTEIPVATIATANVYILADGREIPQIEGEDAATIEAAIYNAFVPSFYLDMIKKVCRKLNLDVMAVCPENYAITQWINELAGEKNDFVIMDIAEDSTNATVVFGGGITSTKSLEIGYLHFIEGISDKMGLTLEEAEKVLNFYMSGKLTNGEVTIVQNCVREILEIWLMGVEQLFGEFNGVRTFAPKIFITGAGAQIPDLIASLENEPWTKTIPFKDVPQFRKLDVTNFGRITDSTGKVSEIDWMNTASLSKIYEELVR